MIKNRTSIVDDRGYNQGFRETYSSRKRMERRADWMIKEMDAKKEKKVLEIGCGTGYISYCIAKNTNLIVTGSDLCDPFIQEAKITYQAPNLSYSTLDFNKAVKSVNERFDYIVGNGILHHLYYNIDDVLLTFRKLLHPGGKIVFIEPNIHNPYVAVIFRNKKLRIWAKLEPDEMAFSKAFIKAKLKSADFNDIDIRYKDFLLPGIPGFLVKPSIFIGDIIERTPIKRISQSIMICARI